MMDMSLTHRKKNLLAGVLGIFLLVALDFGLTLVGVVPLAERDQFAGFSDIKLYLPVSKSAKQTLYQRNPSRNRYFNPQEFVLPKPTEQFRIFSFGGSTTYGRPYLHETSFSSWLERLLKRYAPGPDYQVINAGGISYASYRVRSLMTEVVDYQPDLFVVYSGHNEFLESRTFSKQKNEHPAMRQVRSILHHSSIYSVLKRGIDRINKSENNDLLPAEEVDARLEKIGGTELYHRDPEFRANVIRQYRQSINAMIDLAQERQVPILFCTLPSNLSGVSPFKSEHRHDLTAQDWASWQRAFETGKGFLSEGNAHAAIGAFAEAEKIDDRYAELHYRIGQAHELAGQFALAYRSYLRAKEEDIVPLRALDDFNRVLRELSASRKVPLVDVEAFVRRVSHNGIPGNDLFVDHVHPGIEGQQLIAWVILNRLSTTGLIPLDSKTWQKAGVDARTYLRTEFEKITPRYLGMGLWGVGRLYDWAGKQEEAWAPLLQAWQLVKDVPEIPRRLGLLALERGEAELALDFLQEAERLEPGHPRVLVGIAAAYSKLGRATEALTLLDEYPKALQQTPRYLRTLAQALWQLNRRDEAAKHLRAAIVISPADSSLEKMLAEYLILENPGEAREHYQQYLLKSRLPKGDDVVDRWMSEQQLEKSEGR